MNIRLLKANEIECRVQSVSKDNKGCCLIFYKDARCDMRILDEVFGPLGWEREHQTINDHLFCTVRVWDSKYNRWVSKQDVGTESNTEATKGEASDSFKRACFNLGIGRELYTAPFTWVTLGAEDFNAQNKVKTKFYVEEIQYNEDREITYVSINDNKGKNRFMFGKKDICCVECGEVTTSKIATRAIEVFGKIVCKECGLKLAAKQQQLETVAQAAVGKINKTGKK